MKDIIDLRKRREKHFKNDDGTFSVQLYNEDIHYKYDGKYYDVDNKIVDEENFYVNRTNSQITTFSKDSDFLYEINIDDLFLKFSLDNSFVNGINVKDNKIIYSNILNNVDIEYIIKNNKIKENIILKSMDLPNTLLFNITTNCKLIKRDKKIEVFDNEKLVFTFEVPFFIDNNNKCCNNIDFDLFEVDGNYCYSINLDNEWLYSIDRSYPVILDPTIVNRVGDNVYDAFISSLNPEINRNNSNILEVGSDDGDIRRTLLKFELPELDSSCNILNATAYMRAYNLCVYSEDNRAINVHEVNCSWDEENVTWNSINNCFNETIETYFYPIRHNVINEDEEAVSDFDITNLVKKWYSGKENNGVILKWENEVESDNAFTYTAYSKFYDLINETGLRPYLVITYTQQNGIKDYMNYTDIVYLNGVSHINNFNGNLTHSFNVNTIYSKVIPVVLKLINNSERSSNIINSFAYGWKFNVEEELIFETVDNINYIKYLDATNSILYFIENDGLYEDEEGLNYKIKLVNSDYELIDKEKNKKIFSLINGSYKLVKIINNDGSFIEVEYNNSRVSKITTSENKELIFNYSATSINVIGEDFTSVIILDDNRNISSISSLDGDTKIFYLENHLIEKVLDISGQYAIFEYYQPSNKLMKVSQYGNDSTQGNALEFFYEYNSTTVKDLNGKSNVYTFDEVGRTISTVVYSNGLNDLKNTYGFTEKYVDSLNKKSSGSPIIKYTNNLFSNSLFEVGKECNFENTSNYYDDTEGVIGNRALRLFSNNDITYEINEDNYYCISFALKTDIMDGVNFNLIELFEGNEYVVDTYQILGELIDYEYKRYYLKGYFRCGSNLILRISQDSNVNSYIDCIQLEKSKVMNNHNIISNSCFENNLSYWDTSSFNLDTYEDEDGRFEIVSINDEQKAIKIKSAPNIDNVLSQTFEVSGKKGDVYNLSFMYKNEGIYETETGEVGCSVNLRFWDNSEEGQGTWNYPLNIHSDTWQFFNDVIVAENDYESFDLNIMSLQDVNNLYITNVSLVRDVGSIKLNYDNEGNLISTIGLNGEESKISYDINNQMVSTIDPNNRSFFYEYDNTKPSLVLSKISSSGLSESYEYSDRGSLLNKTIKYVSFNLEDGKLYNIRAKGTKNYFDINDSYVVLKEEECNKKAFKLEKVNGLYRFSFSKYYLCLVDSLLKLVTVPNEYSYFNLVRNNNGSFTFVLNHEPNRAITYINDAIGDDEIYDDDFTQQFYFESLENDLFIQEINSYDENDKCLISSKDTLGNITSFEYDDKGNLVSEIEPNGKKYIYEYDNLNRLVSKTAANNKKINYTYNNNELETIKSNDIIFNFEYDHFNRVKNTKVNNYLITNNLFDDVTGNITQITYGNNDKINYEYDEFNNVNKIIKQNNNFEFLYNNLNELTEINSNNLKIKYIYDFANRLSKYSQNDFEIDFKYDANGNVNRKDYRYGFINYNTEYQYNGDDLIDRIVVNDIFIENTYDYLGRIINTNVNDFYNIEYKFITNGKKTSTIIKSMKFDDDLYSFEYDDLFNITAIKKNNILINKYVYNILNELIEEYDYVNDLKFVYSYDNNGNILKVDKVKISLNEILDVDVFKYENSAYSDLLTKYNDISISYDTSFNPIRIGDDILEWENGYELSKYIKGINTYEYKYDVSGIRTSKIVDNIETKFYLEANRVILQDDGNKRIFFIRDEDGELIGFKLFDETYIYKKNLQNDIIGIYDSNKNLIVNYNYDSYGNILSIIDNNGLDITNPDHIGILNPFRFRSYYYDNETGLYYLNKRYYNPKFRRFLNIDSIISSTNTNLGINLFLYCNNNPVLHSDSSGLFTFWDALDVISFVDSAYQMVKKPSVKNAFFLTLDTVSLLPILPSVGSFTKATDATVNVVKTSKKAKTAKVFSNSVENASDIIKPYDKGKYLEELVQKELNLPKYSGNLFVHKGINRQPDIYDKKNNILYEIKNVKYQAYTKQIRDYLEIANNNGATLILYVRGGQNPTQTSKQLLESGIEIRYVDLD